MVLSAAERRELHEAMLDYLIQHGFGSESQVLERALAARTTFEDKPTTLEKKWNTLVRLSRSLTQLEEKCNRLQSELEETQDPTKRASNVAAKEFLPREPCRATFVGHRDTLTSLAFHPFDPLCYSSSEDGTVRTWDLQTKCCVHTAKHVDAVSYIAIEPMYGKILAVACTDQTVKLYDDGECTMTLHGHEHAVTSLSWPVGVAQTLVSASRDGELRVWDVTRGACSASMRVGGFIRSICSAGNICAVGSDDVVVLVNTASKQILRRYGPFGNAIQTVQLSHFNVDDCLIDSHGTTEQKLTMKQLQRQRQASYERDGTIPTYEPMYLATGGRDKNVIILELGSGSTVMKMTAHDNWVRQVTFTANGKHLVTCSDDGKLCILDLSTKQVARTIVAHDHFVTCLALHPSRPLAATGSADNTLRVWPCN